VIHFQPTKTKKLEAKRKEKRKEIQKIPNVISGDKHGRLAVPSILIVGIVCSLPFFSLKRPAAEKHNTTRLNAFK